MKSKHAHQSRFLWGLIPLVAWFFLAFMLISAVGAQDVKEAVRYRLLESQITVAGVKVIIYIDNAGTFTQYPMKVRRFAFETDDFRFLENEGVRLELDTSDEQIKRIEESVREAREAQKGYLDELKSDRESLPEDLIKQANDLADRTDKELRDILLPHQRKRLAELQFRYELISAGMPGFVRGKLGDDLEMDNRARLKIIKARNDIHNKMKPAILEKCVEALNELIAVCDQGQQDELKKYLKGHEASIAPSIEFLIFQLGYESKHNVPINQFDELNSNNRFWLQCDGQLAVDDSVGGFGPEIASLIDACLSNQYADFEIAQHQRDEYYQFDADFDAAVKKAEATEREMTKSLLKGTVAEEKLNEQFRELEREMHQAYLKRFEKVLLPVQRETLDVVFIRRALAKRGLLASLLDGTLSEKLEITSAQKTKLSAKAREVRKKLIEQSREFEEQVLQEFEPAFSKEDYQAFRDRIGKPIKNIPGSPTFILTAQFGR